MKTLDLYYHAGLCLRVPQFVIKRAVLRLSRIEALALIRGAYQDESGAWASLEEAKQIHASILAEVGQ